MITTPPVLTPTVLDFCREVAPSATPVYLPVRPYRGALAQDCFDNVNRLLRLSGGEPVEGWLIWQWPGAFLEAEHHCVARLADGRLRDCTPQQELRVLFVPDPTATFDPDDFFGRPSIRRALTPDALVSRYLAIIDEQDAFMREHLRPNTDLLAGDLDDRLEYFERETTKLSMEMYARSYRDRGFVLKCA